MHLDAHHLVYREHIYFYIYETHWINNIPTNQSTFKIWKSFINHQPAVFFPAPELLMKLPGDSLTPPCQRQWQLTGWYLWWLNLWHVTSWAKWWQNDGKVPKPGKEKRELFGNLAALQQACCNFLSLSNLLDALIPPNTSGSRSSRSCLPSQARTSAVASTSGMSFLPLPQREGTRAIFW